MIIGLMSRTWRFLSVIFDLFTLILIWQAGRGITNVHTQEKGGEAMVIDIVGRCKDFE
jgi:hypothetical protein